MTGFAYPEILRGGPRAASRPARPGRPGSLFDRYLPLIQFEAQQVVGLAIRKEVLRRRGVFATHRTRGLAPTLDPVTLEELDDLFDRLGIVPGGAFAAADGVFGRAAEWRRTEAIAAPNRRSPEGCNLSPLATIFLFLHVMGAIAAFGPSFVFRSSPASRGRCRRAPCSG